MFTYQPRNACICGESLAGRAIEKSYPWGSIRFVHCKCGSWSQSPEVTNESLAMWMDTAEYHGSKGVGYDDYLADEPARRGEATYRVARDLAFLSASSDVLEVGCATGSMLSALRARGCRVSGVDLSSVFAAAAKRLNGIDVTVADALNIGGSYDAILLFGTICNLRNLPAYLRHFRRLLKPSGALVFNFPDASALIPRLYGSRFWMFAPTVSAFMSSQGCEAALGNSGFSGGFQADVQRPSLRKLAHHAKIPIEFPDIHLPAFPVPSMRLSISRKGP